LIVIDIAFLVLGLAAFGLFAVALRAAERL